MRNFALLLMAATLIGCAVDATPDDASDTEAETAAPQLAGKADGGLTFVGMYTTHATTHRAGDITALQLLADADVAGVQDANYVRERCYHTTCSLPRAESDHFAQYSSSTGNTYLRFWSTVIGHSGTGFPTSTPVINDVYEVVATRYGIKLRKSYTTRWFSLYAITLEASCAAAGATETPIGCLCPLNSAGTFPVQNFVAGAGGCIARPADNESNCDDTGGRWFDDDDTLVGAYCLCSQGYHLDSTGGCVAI